MLKLQDFKDKGYLVSKCEKNSKLEKDWAKWLCQKGIYEDIACGWVQKKYFINVYVSDKRFWNLPAHFHDWVTPRTLTIKLTFERNDLTFWISIAKHKEFQSITEIEELCEEVWSKLGCDHYE